MKRIKNWLTPKNRIILGAIFGSIFVGAVVFIVIFTTQEQPEINERTDTNTTINNKENQQDHSENNAQSETLETSTSQEEHSNKSKNSKTSSATDEKTEQNEEKPQNTDEPEPEPQPEPSPEPTPQPEPQGQDFTIFKLTTTPNLFGRGLDNPNVGAEQGAYNADWSMIAFKYDGVDENYHASTPVDWYNNIRCEVYVGNTKNSTVAKYALSPVYSSDTVLMPYKSQTSQICQYIYNNVGKRVLVKNGNYIIKAFGNPYDRDANYYRSIISHSSAVYFEYSFSHWKKEYIGEVSNTYPNF